MKALPIILTSIWLVPSIHAQYGGGTGKPDDPYRIYTAEQMNKVGLREEDWDKHFRLMADIDLRGYAGTDFNIIGYFQNRGNYKSFTGVFDGNSHSISNFSYASSDADYVGLFGHISRQAMVKDLGLVDPNIDAGTGDNVGSLVGRLKGGTIAGCYVEGGTVAGHENVGGLIGAYDELESVRRYEPPPYTISHCRSTSTVRGNKWVGGLVGANYYGLITDCYATGSVSGKEIVGGLLGQSGRGDILSNISPTLGTMINCHSAGLVSGESNVGSLVGSYIEGPIIGCFWDIETTGQTFMPQMPRSADFTVVKVPICRGSTLPVFPYHRYSPQRVAQPVSTPSKDALWVANKDCR